MYVSNGSIESKLLQDGDESKGEDDDDNDDNNNYYNEGEINDGRVVNEGGPTRGVKGQRRRGQGRKQQEGEK